MKTILFFILITIMLGLANHGNGQEALTDTTAKLVDSVMQTAADGVTGKGIKDVLQPTEWKVTFQKVFWSIILFLLAWILLRHLSSILERIGERRARYRLAIKGMIPIFRITIWTGVFYFIIANIIAPPWATLLTLLASAGVAIGFASQDILKNIFGGIMILFDRPFQVGDKVEIGKYYGEVTDIGLRTVRLVTPDDSVVTVPNSEVMNTSVSNSNYGESNCQVVAEFYLPVDCDLQKIKNAALKAAAVSRYVYLKKPISVIFLNEHEMGETYIKMRLKAYVLDVRYEFKFKSDMSETVLKALQKFKIFVSHA
jgi:small-conductance mechanosensitive channel